MGINRVWGVIALAGVGVPFAVIAGLPAWSPQWFTTDLGGAPVSIWLLDGAMLVVVLVSVFFRGGLGSDAEDPPADETT